LKRLVGAIDKAGEISTGILEKISIIFIFAMCIIMWFQIFYRYILRLGIPWAEEIAKYLMVWMAMLGAALVMWEKGHVAVEFLYDKIPPKIARWVKLLQLIVQIILVFVIMTEGWKYAQTGWRSISPTTKIPRFYPYLSIPVGAALMLFYSSLLLVKQIYEDFFITKPISDNNEFKQIPGRV
jgi:TRAP-type C4-dicarboxylate transport system permease small subunit